MSEGDKESTFLTAAAAAQKLATALDEKTPKQWQERLANDRNPSRATSSRLPFIKQGRTVLYRENDVEAFIARELARRKGITVLSERAIEAMDAVGLLDGSGSGTGRKFDFVLVTDQMDEQTGERFVQMQVNNPLRVYRMTPDEAMKIGKQIFKAAADAGANYQQLKQKGQL